MRTWQVDWSTATISSAKKLHAQTVENAAETSGPRRGSGKVSPNRHATYLTLRKTTSPTDARRATALFTGRHGRSSKSPRPKARFRSRPEGSERSIGPDPLLPLSGSRGALHARQRRSTQR
jgi:hypothetical protein